jgi:hypothetical protein
VVEAPRLRGYIEPAGAGRSAFDVDATHGSLGCRYGRGAAVVEASAPFSRLSRTPRNYTYVATNPCDVNGLCICTHPYHNPYHNPGM